MTRKQYRRLEVFKPYLERIENDMKLYKANIVWFETKIHRKSMQSFKEEIQKSKEGILRQQELLNYCRKERKEIMIKMNKEILNDL